MKAILALALTASTLALPTSVSAGMIYEGLQPFSHSYCDGVSPQTSDAHIPPPADAWDNASPDGNTLAGKPAWDAKHCHDAKIEGAPRHHKKKPAAQRPVPQK